MRPGMLKKLVATDIFGGGGAAPSSLLTGLVSYWKLDETSNGTGAVTRNDSVGSNHLTDVNTTPSAAGIISNAASLSSASSQCLYCADNADSRVGDNDFALSVWCKPTTVTGVMGIIGKYNNTADNKRSYAIYSSGTAITFAVSGDGTAAGGAYNFITSSITMTAGAWHHIMAWHNAALNKIYISANGGIPVEGALSSGAFDSDAPFLVGATGKVGTLANYFNGLIDEGGLWKRLLTPTERATLYNGGSGKTHPF